LPPTPAKRSSTTTDAADAADAADAVETETAVGVAALPGVLATFRATTLGHDDEGEPASPQGRAAAASTTSSMDACGGALLRLNCSWVDCVSTACLHRVLRVADRCDRRRCRPPRGMQVLDYYGTAFESNAVREGGFHRPFVSVRCALTEPSLHHGHQKHGCESWAQEHPRGWVKSWESARSGFVDID
jgi:hypothetical protein